jgi:3-methyladenine DNA glycosylase AlkC
MYTLLEYNFPLLSILEKWKHDKGPNVRRKFTNAASY